MRRHAGEGRSGALSLGLPATWTPADALRLTATDPHGRQLQTSEGTITMVAARENLFLRLFTPAIGPSPMSATAPYPAGGISFLDAIPAMGNKFHTAAQLGPESLPTVATGIYQRTIHLRFTD